MQAVFLHLGLKSGKKVNFRISPLKTLRPNTNLFSFPGTAATAAE